MQNIKLSMLASVLLVSTLTISMSKAEDIASPATIVSTGSPSLWFDETDSGSGAEWYLYGGTASFYLQDDIDDVNHNAKTVFRIMHSLNNENSIMVDSSGDVAFANGSVFIDRSLDRLGVGTTTPTTDLDVVDDLDYIKLDASDGRIDLKDGSSEWAINAHSVYNTLEIINRTSSPSTEPMKILNNAQTDSLVVGEKGIGIGNNAPVEKLDVYQEEDGARLVLTTVGAGEYDAPQFTSRHGGSDGSGNVANTKNKNVLGSFAWRGHDGTDWTGAKAYMMVRAVGDWSGTNTGTKIEIATTPYNSTTAVVGIEIKNHGDVIIPNGNLYVNGTQMNVPDYVFEEDYKLMPLHELKTYISKNNHLPGVVSADEVGKAGVINLSGLQMTLLEKVEELTLYTLQQEEALVSKTVQMKLMEEKISKLEAMQKRLVKVESLLTNLALDTSTIKADKVSVNLK
ncbi:MAG: Unknown protein [uncultured Sulfurovum sp.]|uniref:Peptidase S74 domain-containing protein n=1 Tax=uncultured Sulfurovum sp. TaxID=269237 RepID=A0A6S6TCE9_9BACT|nr:MAG: Unknown protein [uncultured Sulfurovum sp.]